MNLSDELKRRDIKIGWLFWIVGALFYCYTIANRIFPSLISHKLMSSLHINAGEFGLLSASFYLSYTIMQVPVGFLVDRYDIRRVLSLACLSLLLGELVFIYSENLATAIMGRFIMGIGGGFSYVAALKLAAVWLPKERFGLVACATDSLGVLAAMALDAGLIRLINSIGITNSQLIVLAVGVALLIVIALVIRDFRVTIKKYHPQFNVEGERPKESHLWNVIKRITSNGQIWLICLIASFSFIISTVFAEVWGVAYLEKAYSLTNIEASDKIAMLFLGWAIAGPFLGFLSDFVKRRKPVLATSYIIALILFSIVLYMPMLSKTSHSINSAWLDILFFCIGICVGSHPLVFVLCKENFDVKFTGMVIGFANVIINLAGIILQPLVGYILDFMVHKSPHAQSAFTIPEYTFVLTVVPISFILSFILVFFVKETGHKISKKN
jgi:MFS family permease